MGAVGAAGRGRGGGVLHLARGGQRWLGHVRASGRCGTARQRWPEGGNGKLP
jgi:hypothetical protein